MYSTSRDLSIDTNFSFLEPKLINAKIEFNAKRIFFFFFCFCSNEITSTSRANFTRTTSNSTTLIVKIHPVLCRVILTSN